MTALALGVVYVACVVLFQWWLERRCLALRDSEDQ